MSLRNGIQTAEAFESWVQTAPFKLHASDRVRSVENDDLHLGFFCRTHAECHGSGIGIVARADVLDVEHEHINLRQVRRGRRQRLEALAVQADLGHSGDGIAGVANPDHVLGCAANAVLGPEE